MAQEIERRWIVTDIDDSAWAYPSERIMQAYPGAPGMRIRKTRIGENESTELMVKTGYGLERDEDPLPVPNEAGDFLLEHSPHFLVKRRHHRDGWHVDRHETPLHGLVVAEREIPTADTPVELPPWIRSAVEVTNTVANETLAYLGRDLPDYRKHPEDFAVQMEHVRRMLINPPKRICFTGGPCSGKSTAIRQLQEDLPDLFHPVTELATFVIQKLGAPPFPADHSFHNRRFNRNFVHIQRHMEELALDRAFVEGRRAILMDRGTMDNAAYVSGGIAGLEDACLTTAAAEYGRYDAVIFIDMPNREVYERLSANNPARYETYEQAQATGQRTLGCWDGHRNLIVAPDADSWDAKYEGIRNIVMDILGI
ncbi:AAA family ATPase [Patescibacteria group bacterium]